MAKAPKKSQKKSQKNVKTNPCGPLVGVIMGSDSDWPVMVSAHETLNDFKIAHEVRVISAHRTPQEMLDYAMEAKERGLRVLIAGAGGAAHLPGMLASHTVLPVIGVPVNITSLKGIDSFLSIVQMPKGVPVATVAIDNAANAALLAIRILAAGDGPIASALSQQLTKYKIASVKKVKKADRATQRSLNRRRSP